MIKDVWDFTRALLGEWKALLSGGVVVAIESGIFHLTGRTLGAFRGSPSEVSLIVNGRTRGFSPEKLVRVLTCLGRDVDIVVRTAKRGTGKVRVVSQ